MPIEDIEFTIQVPVEASSDDKARELFKKIRDLVEELPSQEEAPEGCPKILLSVHEQTAIIERLDSEVQFRTSELFKNILERDGKKGDLTQTFERQLSRDAMSEIFKAVRLKSGLSQRAFSAENNLSYGDVRRIEAGEATIDKSVEVLHVLGVDPIIHASIK